MIELHQLANFDFSIENISVRTEKWEAGTVCNYMRNSRSRNLIHIIISGNRVCRFDNRDVSLCAGDVLLIPDGTYYRTSMLDANEGIGICFDLFHDGKKILIRPDIYHGWSNNNGSYSSLVRRYCGDSLSICCSQLQLKTLLWSTIERMIANTEIISELGKLLAPAIHYIHVHYKKTVPVGTYAALCGLSESHFRRKFTEYSGMSPIEYRDSVRFNEAEQMLLRGIQVTQIAEQVGFCDASYFRRMYKKRKGIHFRDYHPPELT